MWMQKSPAKTYIARQRLDKHVSAETNAHTTIEQLLPRMILLETASNKLPETLKLNLWFMGPAEPETKNNFAGEGQ
jgi:hypothetical protein